MRRAAFASLGLTLLALISAGCGDTSPPAARMPIPVVTPLREPTDEPAPPAPTDTVVEATATTEAAASTPAAQETEAPTAEATAGTDGGGDGITYEEINEQHAKLTSAQWRAYVASLIGQPYADEGEVYNVRKEMYVIDNPRIEIQVDRDTGEEVVEVDEVSAFIDPNPDAARINKKQPIRVAGTIEAIECMVYCHPYLKDATYEIVGDLLPEKLPPKVDVFDYIFIQAKRRELTDLQWELYVEWVTGTKMTGEGYVYDVANRFIDENFDLQIGFEKPDAGYAPYNVTFEIPVDGADTLSKGDAVTFEGIIKEVEFCIIETCSVVLEQATYTKK